jgi:hypothetical protein
VSPAAIDAAVEGLPVAGPVATVDDIDAELNALPAPRR